MSGKICSMSDRSDSDSKNNTSQSGGDQNQEYDDVGSVFGKNFNQEQTTSVEVEGFEGRRVAAVTVGSSAKFQKDVNVQVNLDGIGSKVVGIDAADDATVRGNLTVKMTRPKK